MTEGHFFMCFVVVVYVLKFNFNNYLYSLENYYFVDIEFFIIQVDENESTKVSSY